MQLLPQGTGEAGAAAALLALQARLVLQSGLSAQRMAAAQAGMQETAEPAERCCIFHQQLLQQRSNEPHSTAGQPCRAARHRSCSGRRQQQQTLARW